MDISVLRLPLTLHPAQRNVRAVCNAQTRLSMPSLQSPGAIASGKISWEGRAAASALELQEQRKYQIRQQALLPSHMNSRRRKCCILAGIGNVEQMKDYKMDRVCDRLIEVFLIEKTSPADWRKLLAFSEEWPNIRPHFFQRCSTNAKAEGDPKRRGDLLKLARKMKEVDEDMMRHDELLEEIEKDTSDLEAIVARRRKDFTSDFIDHLHTKCNANSKNLDRRDEIINLAKKCYLALEAYDAVQEDEEATGEAQLKFDDILNSPSLEAAVNKIDKLAQRQQLDSKLMLLITKAWAAAKESNMMKDEVKDIMFHLYNVAIGNMQRLVPKEVRIIRYLLSIQDPLEMRAALTEAFSPGSELEGTNEDLLYTTPAKLLEWINIVLDSYRTSKQGSLIKEAQKLMNPEVIARVELLKRVVEDQFM